MEPKLIRAKFDSRCGRCYLPIFKGNEVMWTPGSAAVHVDCEKVRAIVAKKKRKTRTARKAPRKRITAFFYCNAEDPRFLKNYTRVRPQDIPPRLHDDLDPEAIESLTARWWGQA